MSDMPDEIWVDNADDWGIWSTDQSSQYDTRYIRAADRSLLLKTQRARNLDFCCCQFDEDGELVKLCAAHAEIRDTRDAEIARLRRIIEEAQDWVVVLSGEELSRNYRHTLAHLKQLLEIEDR